MASILKEETESHLNKTISRLESKNGVEIAVVTVPETSPEPSPKAFATKLFNYWGIGKAEENNGILMPTVSKNLDMEGKKKVEM
ncbi:TPM domain-containing protein [Pleurocapsales cyanobacterium LEGE 10410]|nr:TPM domain-containing protein [Pleurocapsales cyanobacterium LEGE 10410]